MNVPGCPAHTAVDQRGDRIRIKPCNSACVAVAEAQKGAPLTDFLCKLMKYKDADVAKADPDKAAAHYGISRDHAAGYIRLEKQQRGIA